MAGLSLFLGSPGHTIVSKHVRSRHPTHTSVSGQGFQHHVVEGHRHLSCVYIHARVHHHPT
jgi:hypothetical protein